MLTLFLTEEFAPGFSESIGILDSCSSHLSVFRFLWPLQYDGSITSAFGYREDPFTGEKTFHGGVDIAASKGTPVLAADDGIVETANFSDPWGGGYGYYVRLRHDDVYETLYGHCSSICVRAGQTVQRGEVIGYVGSTGNSTGNHLHFETLKYGNRYDPLSNFS